MTDGCGFTWESIGEVRRCQYPAGHYPAPHRDGMSWVSVDAELSVDCWWETRKWGGILPPPTPRHPVIVEVADDSPPVERLIARWVDWWRNWRDGL